MDTLLDDEREGGVIIETHRLRLRALRPDDLDALQGIFGDPRVMAGFDSCPFEEDQTRSWLIRALDHWERHGIGLFAVLDKTANVLIGDCGLELIDLDGEQVAELGYDLRSDHWGRGLATEAAAAVRDHAFEVLGLPRVVSLIRVGNSASRRVAEKIGLRRQRDLTRYGTAYWVYGLSSPLARDTG